ncbi:MAG: hypothetical protein ABIR70_07310 [Bryobacteraceae bacterium]
MTRFFGRLAVILLFASPAFAVDLEIRFGVLERLIGEQMFTADGRRYVQGSKDERCRYAFLEKPRLSAVGDRLQLKVNFTGKTALGMFGKCVGVGDAFELTVTAKPISKNGEVDFEQFVVSTPRDSFYIRRVRAVLVETLNKNFQLNIMQQARKLIEAPQQTGKFQQEIRDISMSGVRVAPDSLVLAIDFRVIVK